MCLIFLERILLIYRKLCHLNLIRVGITKVKIFQVKITIERCLIYFFASYLVILIENNNEGR